MAQAAATPKTMFDDHRDRHDGQRQQDGVARVGVAERGCSSRRRTPSASAWTKTLTTGTTTKTPTTATAAPISSQRTQRIRSAAVDAPARAARIAPARRGADGELSRAMPLAPALEQVDEHQHRERDHQQHDGDGGRLAVGELLQPGDDQHRRDLRLVRHVAGDEHHRAVLAEAAREGQREAGHQRRATASAGSRGGTSASGWRPARPPPPPSPGRGLPAPAAPSAPRTAGR